MGRRVDDRTFPTLIPMGRGFPPTQFPNKLRTGTPSSLNPKLRESGFGWGFFPISVPCFKPGSYQCHFILTVVCICRVLGDRHKTGHH